MKRVKVLALIAAMVMLLSACNAINVTKVANIGDVTAQKPEFMYYLEMAKSEAYQLAQAEGNIIQKDADWDTVMVEGKTAAQYAKDKALDSLKMILTLESKAKAAGFEMENAETEIATHKNDMIEQMGGRYGYEQTLSKIGVDLDAFNAIIARSVYANAYMQKMAAEEAYQPSPEAAKEKYDKEYVFVRHILISNQAPQDELIVDEEAAEPVDYAAEAKTEAEDILKKLSEGADFVALMNEHSDDGRGEDGKLSSDGYIMTNNGQMVPEFEEAAMKLEVGAYTTELVETTYGYHIIKRYELPQTGTQYDETIAQITSTLLGENVKNQVYAWADELGFTVNEKFVSKQKIKMEE
ncbi:MAG: peptidylprolyl isomerase [Clostridia bacterium]|nr:peptidylprolyl isomerase [Clostridia bacterium]